jgi:hypothetical protein
LHGLRPVHAANRERDRFIPVLMPPFNLMACLPTGFETGVSLANEAPRRKE